MGKRENETKEERRERKRLKKEKKRKKQERKSIGIESWDNSGTEQKPEDDIFYRRKLELTVSLLPAALENVALNVENSLRKLLLRYSDAVSGIVLAFDNVEILSKAGMILNELPHIHYNVCIDALIFHPKVGCRLTGTVTESFHSHISLLVFDYFNASVSSQQMVESGFVFDDVTLTWCKGETTLAKGDQLDFTNTKLYEANGIISMDGTKPSL